MTGWAGWGRWRAAAPYTPFLAAAVLAVAALAESLAGSLGTAHAARFDHTVSRPAPGMTGLPPGVPHPVAPPPPTGRDAALLLVILPWWPWPPPCRSPWCGRSRSRPGCWSPPRSACRWRPSRS
ncbi:hypothetical protein [Thermocatellispora tengchongensis]|uniref:hypothetical protein n=1 Tax=Thermocatellispora tengchongensis TaxID=1073253 RepID=UPI00363F31F6